MDFTELIIFKNATKAQLEQVDNRDSTVFHKLSRKNVELLKGLMVMTTPATRIAAVSALIWIPYSQLVGLLISIEKTHPHELGEFFEYVNTQGFSSVSTLRRKLTYLVHALYFSDVFSDPKYLK